MRAVGRKRVGLALAAAAGFAACTSCSAVRVAPARLPVQMTIVREQLVIHSDTPVPAQHRLFQDLTAQRGELLSKLALPGSDEPIHVYLFNTPERFDVFMRLRFPQFPSRRAFFVEGDTELAVYAYWGERVAEDLRHEVAHGYLHSAVRNIPLWLDEGLAEYFEVPRGSGGLNRPHVNQLAVRLAAGGWRPDLRRVEALASAGEMTQFDYAESWAWAHWMLETTPPRKELLRAYFKSLKETGTAEPLSTQLERIEPNAARGVAEHIFQLALPR